MGPNGCLSINLAQKYSLNRDISRTHYFSWHKLKCGLFTNLVIRPEVPGNADNEEQTKRGHVTDCPASGEETGIQQSMCSICSMQLNHKSLLFSSCSVLLIL